MRLSDAIDGFEQHLRANGCSRHTIRAYRCDLAGLARYYGGNGARVEDVTPADLAAFMTSEHALVGPTGRTRGPGAINRVRATLRSFFGWLADTGQLGASPARALRVKALRQPPPPALDREDEERLLATLEASEDPLAFRDYVMIRVLLGTGVRVGELVCLDAADVDLGHRRLTVRCKGGGREVRHLTTSLATLLESYMYHDHGTVPGQRGGPLFVSRSGRRMTARQFARRLEGWLEEAGVSGHITPHTFRHTLATRLLAATGDLRLVQRALGHRSITTTTRYAQVPDEALATALEAV